MSRKILAVPAVAFDKIGRFQGFEPNYSDKLTYLLEHAVVVDRETAETDEDYQQIIPYAVVFRGDQVFIYRRGKAGNENRLHALYSIGVGGHIDTVTCADAGKQVLETLMREIKEEIGVDTPTVKIVGLLNDDSNAVGRVHLGIVYHVFVDDVGETENTIEDHGFVDFDQIASYNLEGWSKILVDSGVHVVKQGKKKK